jgi:hypothetical protein
MADADEMNSVVIDVSMRMLDDVEGRSFEEWTELERVIVTLWWLEADVNNGGFDQYFFNSGGNYAQFAPHALRTIGAPKMAAIVERANAVFGPKGPPSDRQERQRQLHDLREDVSEALHALDDEFYAYPEDLTKLAYEYLARCDPDLVGL